MTRRPGTIETAILQALANHPGRRFSVSELAGIVYGLQPNPAGVVIAPEAQAGAVRSVFADRAICAQLDLLCTRARKAAA